MAREETDIVHTIMRDTSPLGARLWKNVRGLFYTKPEVEGLVSAIKRGNIPQVMAAIKKLRQVMGGLQAAGASDLIGFRPVVITQEMVGTTIAVFCALEVKTATGAATGQQPEFIDFVLKSGGFAGLVRDSVDAKIIMKYPVDSPHGLR